MIGSSRNVFSGTSASFIRARTRSSALAAAKPASSSPERSGEALASNSRRSMPIFPGRPPIRALLRSGFFHQLDFEQLGPAFAGHPQPVGAGIVSDSVEHVLVASPVAGSEDAREVNPSHYLPAGRIDPGDAVRLVHVGVHLAFDPLQFVQFVHLAGLVGHGHPAHFAQRLGVPKPQLRRAVTHNDALSILREAPSFSGIHELAFGSETGQIVDEAQLVFPGQLQQAIFPVNDAFAEILLRNLPFFEHFAGFELHLADRGFSPQAGALVHRSVEIEESLCVGLRIMRIRMHDLVAVFGNAAGLRSRPAGAGKKAGSRYQESHTYCSAYRERPLPNGRGSAGPPVGYERWTPAGLPAAA